jgi:hypothetical protein
LHSGTDLLILPCPRSSRTTARHFSSLHTVRTSKSNPPKRDAAPVNPTVRSTLSLTHYTPTHLYPLSPRGALPFFRRTQTNTSTTKRSFTTTSPITTSDRLYHHRLRHARTATRDSEHNPFSDHTLVHRGASFRWVPASRRHHHNVADSKDIRAVVTAPNRLDARTDLRSLDNRSRMHHPASSFGDA